MKPRWNIPQVADLPRSGRGADVIVFGTPAYFYPCTGQLKVLFDRTVAIYPDLPNKQYYYLLAQGDGVAKILFGGVDPKTAYELCEGESH